MGLTKTYRLCTGAILYIPYECLCTVLARVAGHLFTHLSGYPGKPWVVLKKGSCSVS